MVVEDAREQELDAADPHLAPVLRPRQVKVLEGDAGVSLRRNKTHVLHRIGTAKLIKEKRKAANALHA
jgi:hypothetical protein